jgi:hypothetical protein
VTDEFTVYKKAAIRVYAPVSNQKIICFSGTYRSPEELFSYFLPAMRESHQRAKTVASSKPRYRAIATVTPPVSHRL